MKILFLTPRCSKKNLGGVEGHVRLLTEELERRGHEVKELSLDEIDGLNKGPAFVSKGRALGYKFKAWGYLWEKRDLFKWADVIHIHDVFWWYAPFAVINKGQALLRQQGLAFVGVTFHGWEGVCPPTRSAVIQKKAAAFLSDGAMAVGNFFEKWYGVKTDRIVWGANTIINKGPAFRLAKGRALRQIVFLGRLEGVNGVEVLLETLNRKDGPLMQRTVLYRFIFVGDGSYKKQAEKFGKVTGMVKNPEKYLTDADVVITSSYMSMLEVAAMGKPIISIANNELKMDYLNCHPLRKWIMICRNYEELIRAIREIGEIRGDRGIKYSRQWAEKQTPERLADEYEELWKEK